MSHRWYYLFRPLILILINTFAASLTEFAAKPVTKHHFPDFVVIP
jgi:hypothetical protein